jgi:non-homologous end joining protein Ku
MTVLKSDELKMIELKGEKAVFRPEELKELRQRNETGVKVIGYLHRDSFDQFTWFRSEGYFLYPDEERVNGSTEIFTTLLKRCHVLQVELHSYESINKINGNFKNKCFSLIFC